MFAKLSSSKKAFLIALSTVFVVGAAIAAVELMDTGASLLVQAFVLLVVVAAVMCLWLWDSINATSVTAPEKCKKLLEEQAQRAASEDTNPGTPVTVRAESPRQLLQPRGFERR